MMKFMSVNELYHWRKEIVVLVLLKKNICSAN
jgi:hypothetical protein